MLGMNLLRPILIRHSRDCHCRVQVSDIGRRRRLVAARDNVELELLAGMLQAIPDADVVYNRISAITWLQDVKTDRP